jgi:hypothetical protein
LNCFQIRNFCFVISKKIAAGSESFESTSAKTNPCDPYWYSVENPAVIDCRNNLHEEGEYITKVIRSKVERGMTISASDSEGAESIFHFYSRILLLFIK